MLLHVLIVIAMARGHNKIQQFVQLFHPSLFTPSQNIFQHFALICRGCLSFGIFSVQDVRIQKSNKDSYYPLTMVEGYDSTLCCSKMHVLPGLQPSSSIYSNNQLFQAINISTALLEDVFADRE